MLLGPDFRSCVMILHLWEAFPPTCVYRVGPNGTRVMLRRRYGEKFCKCHPCRQCVVWQHWGLMGALEPWTELLVVVGLLVVIQQRLCRGACKAQVGGELPLGSPQPLSRLRAPHRICAPCCALCGLVGKHAAASSLNLLCCGTLLFLEEFTLMLVSTSIYFEVLGLPCQ